MGAIREINQQGAATPDTKVSLVAHPPADFFYTPSSCGAIGKVAPPDER
jgi:hypothetical protein